MNAWSDMLSDKTSKQTSSPSLGHSPKFDPKKAVFNFLEGGSEGLLLPLVGTARTLGNRMDLRSLGASGTTTKKMQEDKRLTLVSPMPPAAKWTSSFKRQCLMFDHVCELGVRRRGGFRKGCRCNSCLLSQ